MAQRKITLYGKESAQEEILEEINRLLYAKGNKPYPLKPSEIAKTIGMCRQSVYNYIKKLSDNGKMIRLQSGHFFLPKSKDAEFRQFNKLHKFTSDPLVSEWMDDLITRKQGMPVKTWKNRLRSVEIVCNTCKVTPQELIVSKKKTEKIMRTFAKHFQNGDVIRFSTGRKPLFCTTFSYHTC